MPARQAGPFALYGITLGAYIGALLWVATRAPAVVRSVLGALGPEATRSTFVGFFAVTGAVFLIVLPVLSTYPGLMVKLLAPGPQRSYWSAPEHLGEFSRRLRRDMFVIGPLGAMFLLCAMLASVQTTISGGPAPLWFGISVLVILGLLFAYGLVSASRYRVPPPA